MKITTGMKLKTSATTWTVRDVIEYADVMDPTKKIRMALLDTEFKGATHTASMSEENINLFLANGSMRVED